MKRLLSQLFGKLLRTFQDNPRILRSTTIALSKVPWAFNLLLLLAQSLGIVIAPESQDELLPAATSKDELSPQAQEIYRKLLIQSKAPTR